MQELLANIIKSKRKALGLSQKELADGICTQTVISKIEKAALTPSVDIFFKLINKLNIPMDEVATLYSVSQEKKESIYSDNIRNLIYKRDWTTLDIINKSLKNTRLDETDKYYLQWFRALVTHHHKKDFNKALNLLDDILKKANKDSNVYLCALYSKAALFDDTNQLDESKQIFEQLLDKQHLFKNKEDRLKLLLGFTRLCIRKNDIDNAITYNSLVLEEILKSSSIKYLGTAYFFQYNIYCSQSLYHRALDSIQKALTLFEIENNELLKNLALSAISYVKEKIKNEEIS